MKKDNDKNKYRNGINLPRTPNKRNMQQQYYKDITLIIINIYTHFII